MQIRQVNHYHHRPDWNTIICVLFYVRNINSVCLSLSVVPDEKLHTIFFMCDNKINWIPQLFRNKELKYFKRSWSKIRPGKQFFPTVISCLTAQQFSTIFFCRFSWNSARMDSIRKTLTSIFKTLDISPIHMTLVHLGQAGWMNSREHLMFP